MNSFVDKFHILRFIQKIQSKSAKINIPYLSVEVIKYGNLEL